MKDLKKQSDFMEAILFGVAILFLIFCVSFQIWYNGTPEGKKTIAEKEGRTKQEEIYRSSVVEQNCLKERILDSLEIVINDFVRNVSNDEYPYSTFKILQPQFEEAIKQYVSVSYSGNIKIDTVELIKSGHNYSLLEVKEGTKTLFFMNRYLVDLYMRIIDKTSPSQHDFMTCINGHDGYGVPPYQILFFTGFTSSGFVYGTFGIKELKNRDL